MSEKRVRASNIELLRLLSMFAILMHHMCYHSNMIASADSSVMQLIIANLLSSGGKIGVNIFILITGYFSVLSSNSFSVVKLLRICLQLITYSILGYLLCCAVSPETFSLLSLVKSFFPVVFEQWWFATAYVLLYILTPFLNVPLSAMRKSSYQKLLTAVFLLWSVIPTFTTKSLGSNDLIWLVCMYCTGGYLRRYPPFAEKKPGFFFKAAIALYCAVFVSTILIILAGSSKMPSVLPYACYFFGMQRIPGVLLSILIFIGFSRLEMPRNAALNKCAAAAFGVYLIHDHPGIRALLWTHPAFSSLPDSMMYLPALLLIGLLLFSACILIEMLRSAISNRLFSPMLTTVASNITNLFERFFKSN